MGKPEGVSNVFLTYFDYFFGGSIQTWSGREAPERVKPPPPPDKSSIEEKTHFQDILRLLKFLSGICSNRTATFSELPLLCSGLALTHMQFLFIYTSCISDYIDSFDFSGTYIYIEKTIIIRNLHWKHSKINH